MKRKPQFEFPEKPKRKPKPPRSYKVYMAIAVFCLSIGLIVGIGLTRQLSTNPAISPTYDTSVVYPPITSANATQLHPISSIHGRVGNLSSLMFSPDGSSLMSVLDKSLVRLQNLRTGEENNTLFRQNNTLRQVIFASNNDLVAIGFVNTTLYLWRTGAIIYTMQFNEYDRASMALSPDGSLFAVTDEEGNVRLLDALTDKLRTIIPGQRNDIVGLDFNSTGRLLAISRHQNPG